MGIFNRRQEDRAVNAINEGRLQQYTLTGIGQLFDNSRPFASSYLWMVLLPAYRALGNFRYTCDAMMGESEARKVAMLIDFIDKNQQQLHWLGIHYGYIVVDTDRRGLPYIPDYTKIKTDRFGNVTDYECVYYMPEYAITGKSMTTIMRNNMNALDTFKNGQINLTERYGALGILSGKDMPVSPDDKSEFEAQLRDDYGIRNSKKQMLFSTRPVDFKQIHFPIKDLELTDNVKEEIKYMAGMLQVPYDIIPFSGASTYANQEQAMVSLYRNCLSPIAEIMLAILRKLVKMDTKLLIPSDRISFTIDNVPELADDMTGKVDFCTKVAQLIGTMKEAGLDTTELETKLNDEIHGMQ